jgi:hypothetical protein
MSAAHHYADDRIAIASSPSLLVAVLRKPMTLDTANSLRGVAKRFYAQNPGGGISLTIIERGAAASQPPEVRAVNQAMAKESKVLASALVLEGSGFGVATMRAVIAAVYFAVKKEYPSKVFENTGEAARWLAPQLKQIGVDLSPERIASLVEETRARFVQ